MYNTKEDEIKTHILLLENMRENNSDLFASEKLALDYAISLIYHELKQIEKG